MSFRRLLALATVSGIGAVVSGSAALEAAQTRAGETLKIDARRLPFVRAVDDRFQSYQIGFSHLTGGETWKAYDALKGPAKDIAEAREARTATDLNNPRLLALTRALAPFYLRFSGTTTNSVYFQDDDRAEPAAPPAGFKVVLTRKRWKSALEFARATNTRILTSFAVSDGVRDAAHNWTPTMAEKWLAYTRSIGGDIYAAELYNEPNAPEYPHMPKGYSADQFARDFATFRATMAKVAPQVKLAGPGNATLGLPGGSALMKPTPEEYASASPRPRFDIFSYHFYPVIAQRCAPADSPQSITADKALSEDFLSRPDRQFQEIRALRDKYAPGAPIWLTETGGAACGGLIWQPTFLDVFRYADTQARLAKQGLDAMFTHALISGSNGIIDEKTFEPNASYWAAVLWRRLMGTKVLNVGETRPELHLYANCLRGSNGGVVLLALNLSTQEKTLEVGAQAQLYALTAPELQSRTVLLNGRKLAIRPDNHLPAMPYAAVKGGLVRIGPTSVNFIALPSAKNRACTDT